MVYMQPRANLSSVGRQPFRPGQWQGFKGVSKNTTYVQNNFFGGAYGGYYDSALNYYNTGSCCDGGGMSKGMKWLMGLGVGTTLLGGILSLFKKDKNEEAGGTPPANTASDQIRQMQEQINKLQKQLSDAQSAKEPVATAPKEKPVVEQKPKEEVKPQEDPYKDFGKNGIICRDASGYTRNIKGLAGQVTITKAGSEGQPPQEFTITDTSENSKGNTYTYQLSGTSSDGKPIYTCVSKNGQSISSGNQYTYDNGELVQYQNQDGFGRGLKTDAQLSRPSGENGGGVQQTFSQKMEVNTSAGPATITVTASSQEELNQKVEAEKDKSESWQPVTDMINGKGILDTPWSKYATASSTGQQQQSPQSEGQVSQATQQVNANLQKLEGDRKKMASGTLDNINKSNLPEAQKEQLRQKLADATDTKGLPVPINSFKATIAEINKALMA